MWLWGGGGEEVVCNRSPLRFMYAAVWLWHSDSCIQSSDSCIQSSGTDDHSCVNWGDYGYGFVGYLLRGVGGWRSHTRSWPSLGNGANQRLQRRGTGEWGVGVGVSLSFWAHIQGWGSWGNRSTQPVGILAQLWGGGGGTHLQLCELCQRCQWSPPPTFFFLSTANVSAVQAWTQTGCRTVSALSITPSATTRRDLIFSSTQAWTLGGWLTQEFSTISFARKKLKQIQMGVV